MGNLHSVQKAFQRLKAPITRVKSHLDFKECDALILPGVGAFDPAIENLNKVDLIPSIKEWVKNGKPFLGICLGLQLLFESSEEGSLPGLGLLSGHIHRLPKNQGERIPHMGWAPLKYQNQCPLFKADDPESWMYFVHSYSAIPKDKKHLASTVNFGKTDVTAIVWKEKFGACQFHPEKSGIAGQKMLSRWLKWLEGGASTVK